MFVKAAQRHATPPSTRQEPGAKCAVLFSFTRANRAGIVSRVGARADTAHGSLPSGGSRLLSLPRSTGHYWRSLGCLELLLLLELGDGRGDANEGHAKGDEHERAHARGPLLDVVERGLEHRLGGHRDGPER